MSLPKRLRYYLQHDREALNSALRIFLDEIERHLRAQSPGAGPDARAGALAFIHRFGSSLNLQTHFHVCVIDGVFVPNPEQEVRFIAVGEMNANAAEAVQARVRRRILRALVRSGILEKDDRKEMELWNHGGGFSLDATVRIAADDRHGLERLLRYCARPPFAAERLQELDAHRLIYHLPKPGPDGRTCRSFSRPWSLPRTYRRAGTAASNASPPLLRGIGPQCAPAGRRYRPGPAGRSRAARGAGADCRRRAL